jgi:hypothetical protein
MHSKYLMIIKHKFIEKCILLDIYTNTIKEIVDIIEKKVDEIIFSSKLSNTKIFYILLYYFIFF